jgi:hypothetical protein
MTEPRAEAVVALAEARHRGCEMELAKWAGTEELRERYMLHDVSSHIPSSTEDLAALRAAGWDVTPLAEADRAAAQERARLRKRADSLIDVDPEGNFRLDALLADPEPEE